MTDYMTDPHRHDGRRDSRGYNLIQSECHPRITNMRVGGNGPPIEFCDKLGEPRECDWVAVAVGVEQPAAGRAGIVSLANE